MWNSRRSYKSIADYDYHRIIQQKRNFAQVEKVLNLYENNNHSLVDQVHQLIKENQTLRKQVKSPSLHKSKMQAHKPNFSVSQANENSQINTTVRSTTKKHNITMGNSKVRINHPRDVYLPAQEAHHLNMKRLRQIRTAHKAYDKSREFQQFKEKLSAQKQQLKKSYNKNTNLQNSDLSLSRNVYINRQQVETNEFHERKPLIEVQKVQPVTLTFNPSLKLSKKDNSPYGDFKKQTPCHSPSRATGRSYKEPLKSAQRSSSAIKMEQIYPHNSIRIPEPKTKWGDLSSTYFQGSKLIKNDQLGMVSSKKYYEGMDQSKSGKSKRKKFLNVISQSALEDKIEQKGPS